jgi:hypothetical protein
MVWSLLFSLTPQQFPRRQDAFYLNIAQFTKFVKGIWAICTENHFFLVGRGGPFAEPAYQRWHCSSESTKWDPGVLAPLQGPAFCVDMVVLIAFPDCMITQPSTKN